MDTFPMMVVDVEATCCDDNSLPIDESEIIEIGAVGLNTDLKISGQFEAPVKPVRHAILHPFCKRLTGIMQRDVDGANGFSRVWPGFLEFALSVRCPSSFASWGQFDRWAFIRDCAYHELENPFVHHRDLAKVFTKHTGKRRGHRGAMEYLNIPYSGSHHRGADDARNIVLLVQHFRKLGWL